MKSFPNSSISMAMQYCWHLSALTRRWKLNNVRKATIDSECCVNRCVTAHRDEWSTGYQYLQMICSFLMLINYGCLQFQSDSLHQNETVIWRNRLLMNGYKSHIYSARCSATQSVVFWITKPDIPMVLQIHKQSSLCRTVLLMHPL